GTIPVKEMVISSLLDFSCCFTNFYCTLHGCRSLLQFVQRAQLLLELVHNFPSVVVRDRLVVKYDLQGPCYLIQCLWIFLMPSPYFFLGLPFASLISGCQKICDDFFLYLNLLIFIQLH